MAFKYKDYTESDEVKKAAAELSAKQAAAPTYESGFEKKLSDIMGRIENREKFSYDMNADPLYQQLKDSARRSGKLAMRDAMGQAATLTGGYGNSYAVSVGQQSQNAELQKLNDMVPTLYQMAREQHDRKGEELLDLYALYSDREAQDYARHRDRVSDHLSELNYLQSRYDAERSFDYGKHTDAQSYAYQVARDAIADSQRQQQAQTEQLKALAGVGLTGEDMSTLKGYNGNENKVGEKLSEWVESGKIDDELAEFLWKYYTVNAGGLMEKALEGFSYVKN